MMLLVGRDIVASTISALQRDGRRGLESVVLWLAPVGTDQNVVLSVYRPVQVAQCDWFEIPPAGVRELLEFLRKYKLRAVAQVHSHPGPAFHSAADDKWAIVRQAGALSLVLPAFALRTSIETFDADCATYQFSLNAQWRRVDLSKVVTWV